MILVDEYDHFIEGARFDWLHPSCGRWPDLVAMFVRSERDKDGLLVGVWWDGHVYAVAIEGPSEQHEILQTYRWEPKNANGTLWQCRVHAYRAAELDTEVNRAIRIRQIAQASCHLFMETG